MPLFPKKDSKEKQRRKPSKTTDKSVGISAQDLEFSINTCGSFLGKIKENIENFNRNSDVSETTDFIFLPSTLTNLSERLKSLPKLTIAATPNIAATANKELRNAKANMLKAVTLANSIRKKQINTSPESLLNICARIIAATVNYINYLNAALPNSVLITNFHKTVVGPLETNINLLLSNEALNLKVLVNDSPMNIDQDLINNRIKSFQINPFVDSIFHQSLSTALTDIKEKNETYDYSDIDAAAQKELEELEKEQELEKTTMPNTNKKSNTTTSSASNQNNEKARPSNIVLEDNSISLDFLKSLPYEIMDDIDKDENAYSKRIKEDRFLLQKDLNVRLVKLLEEHGHKNVVYECFHRASDPNFKEADLTAEIKNNLEIQKTLVSKNISPLKTIFFRINMDNRHWVTLAVLPDSKNNKKARIRYVDPMHDDKSKIPDFIIAAVKKQFSQIEIIKKHPQLQYTNKPNQKNCCGLWHLLVMEEMMASGHIDCDLDIKLLSKNGVGPESEPKSELIRRNRERLLDEVNKKITDDNLLFYKQLLRLIKELLIIENITILQEFINEQPFIYENNNEIATIIGRTEKTDKFTTFQALYNHVIAAIDKERKEISRFDHLQFLELELSKNINSAKANAVIYGLQLLFHGITNLEELSSLISAYRQSVTTAELAQPTDIAQTIVNSRIQPLSPEATTLKTASETDTDSLHDETLSSEPDDTPQEIKSIRTRAKTALTNLKGGLEKLFNDFEHFSKINASLNDQEIKKSVQKAAGTLRGGKTTVVNPPKYSAIRKHSEAPTLSKESNNNNEYIPDEINYGFIAGKAPESLKEFFEQYTKVSPSQKIENQKRELERIIAKYDPESDAVNFITSTLSQIVDFCAESHKAYNALIQTPVNDKNLSIEAMLHLLQLAESGISMTELLAQAAPILAKHKIRPINSKTCTNNDEFNKKLYKRFNKDQTVDLIKNIEIFLDATKTFIANCGPAITLLSNSGVRIGISAFRGYFTQTFTEYAAICKLLQRALIVVEADKSLQQKAIDCSTACHEAAQQVNGFNVNQLLREQPNIDLGPGIVTQKTALQKATFACLDPYEKETCSTMLEMTNLCMNVRDGYYKLNNLPYEKTNLPIIKVLMLAKLLEKNPPNLLAEVNEVLLKSNVRLIKKEANSPTEIKRKLIKRIGKTQKEAFLTESEKLLQGMLINSDRIISQYTRCKQSGFRVPKSYFIQPLIEYKETCRLLQQFFGFFGNNDLKQLAASCADKVSSLASEIFLREIPDAAKIINENQELIKKFQQTFDSIDAELSKDDSATPALSRIVKLKELTTQAREAMQLVNYYRNALTYDHPLIKLEKSLRLLKGEADFFNSKINDLNNQWRLLDARFDPILAKINDKNATALKAIKVQDLTTLITNTHEILLNSNKLNQILRDAETAVLDTRDQAAINESTKKLVEAAEGLKQLDALYNAVDRSVNQFTETLQPALQKYADLFAEKNAFIFYDANELAQRKLAIDELADLIARFQTEYDSVDFAQLCAAFAAETQKVGMAYSEQKPISITQWALLYVLSEKINSRINNIKKGLEENSIAEIPDYTVYDPAATLGEDKAKIVLEKATTEAEKLFNNTHPRRKEFEDVNNSFRKKLINLLTFQDFVYQVYHESAIPALANKVFATELRTDFKGLPETANALVSQLGLDALSGNHEETDSSAKTETITEEVTDMTIEKEKDSTRSSDAKSDKETKSDGSSDDTKRDTSKDADSSGRTPPSDTGHAGSGSSDDKDDDDHDDDKAPKTDDLKKEDSESEKLRQQLAELKKLNAEIEKKNQELQQQMSVLTDANRDISEQNKTLQQTLLTENNNHASQLKQKETEYADKERQYQEKIKNIETQNQLIFANLQTATAENTKLNAAKTANEAEINRLQAQEAENQSAKEGLEKNLVEAINQNQALQENIKQQQLAYQTERANLEEQLRQAQLKKDSNDSSSDSESVDSDSSLGSSSPFVSVRYVDGHLGLNYQQQLDALRVINEAQLDHTNFLLELKLAYPNPRETKPDNAAKQRITKRINVIVEQLLSSGESEPKYIFDGEKLNNNNALAAAFLYALLIEDTSPWRRTSEKIACEAILKAYKQFKTTSNENFENSLVEFYNLCSRIDSGNTKFIELIKLIKASRDTDADALVAMMESISLSSKHEASDILSAIDDTESTDSADTIASDDHTGTSKTTHSDRNHLGIDYHKSSEGIFAIEFNKDALQAEDKPDLINDEAQLRHNRLLLQGLQARNQNNRKKSSVKAWVLAGLGFSAGAFISGFTAYIPGIIGCTVLAAGCFAKAFYNYRNNRNNKNPAVKNLTIKLNGNTYSFPHGLNTILDYKEELIALLIAKDDALTLTREAYFRDQGIDKNSLGINILHVLLNEGRNGYKTAARDTAIDTLIEIYALDQEQFEKIITDLINFSVNQQADKDDVTDFTLTKLIKLFHREQKHKDKQRAQVCKSIKNYILDKAFELHQDATDEAIQVYVAENICELDLAYLADLVFSGNFHLIDLLLERNRLSDVFLYAHQHYPDFKERFISLLNHRLDRLREKEYSASDITSSLLTLSSKIIRCISKEAASTTNASKHVKLLTDIVNGCIEFYSEQPILIFQLYSKSLNSDMDSLLDDSFDDSRKEKTDEDDSEATRKNIVWSVFTKSKYGCLFNFNQKPSSKQLVETLKMVIPDDSCEKTIHDSITAIFSAVMPNDNFGFDIHVIFTQLMNGLKAAKQDHYIVSLRQNIIKVYFEKLNDELSEFFHTYQTASIANIEENITLLFKRHGITEALDGSVIHPLTEALLNNERDGFIQKSRAVILESQLNASQTVANSETSVTSVFDPHRHIAQLLDDIIEHPEVLCAPKATQKRYLKEKIINILQIYQITAQQNDFDNVFAIIKLMKPKNQSVLLELLTDIGNLEKTPVAPRPNSNYFKKHFESITVGEQYDQDVRVWVSTVTTTDPIEENIDGSPIDVEFPIMLLSKIRVFEILLKILNNEDEIFRFKDASAGTAFVDNIIRPQLLETDSANLSNLLHCIDDHDSGTSILKFNIPANADPNGVRSYLKKSLDAHIKALPVGVQLNKLKSNAQLQNLWALEELYHGRVFFAKDETNATLMAQRLNQSLSALHQDPDHIDVYVQKLSGNYRVYLRKMPSVTNIYPNEIRNSLTDFITSATDTQRALPTAGLIKLLNVLYHGGLQVADEHNNYVPASHLDAPLAFYLSHQQPIEIEISGEQHQDFTNRLQRQLNIDFSGSEASFLIALGGNNNLHKEVFGYNQSDLNTDEVITPTSSNGILQVKKTEVDGKTVLTLTFVKDIRTACAGIDPKTHESVVISNVYSDKYSSSQVGIAVEDEFRAATNNPLPRKAKLKIDADAEHNLLTTISTAITHGEDAVNPEYILGQPPSSYQASGELKLVSTRWKSTDGYCENFSRSLLDTENEAADNLRRQIFQNFLVQYKKNDELYLGLLVQNLLQQAHAYYSSEPDRTIVVRSYNESTNKIVLTELSRNAFDATIRDIILKDILTDEQFSSEEKSALLKAIFDQYREFQYKALPSDSLANNLFSAEIRRYDLYLDCYLATGADLSSILDPEQSKILISTFEQTELGQLLNATQENFNELTLEQQRRLGHNIKCFYEADPEKFNQFIGHLLVKRLTRLDGEDSAIALSAEAILIRFATSVLSNSHGWHDQDCIARFIAAIDSDLWQPANSAINFTIMPALSPEQKRCFIGAIGKATCLTNLNLVTVDKLIGALSHEATNLFKSSGIGFFGRQKDADILQSLHSKSPARLINMGYCIALLTKPATKHQAKQDLIGLFNSQTVNKDSLLHLLVVAITTLKPEHLLGDGSNYDALIHKARNLIIKSYQESFAAEAAESARSGLANLPTWYADQNPWLNGGAAWEEMTAPAAPTTHEAPEHPAGPPL